MALSYGRKAASRPSNDSEAQLYVVPAGTEFRGKLNICNQTANQVTYRVAHTDLTGTASSEDWVRYDWFLRPNEWHTINFEMGASETIRIKASTGNAIGFVLTGVEMS